MIKILKVNVENQGNDQSISKIDNFSTPKESNNDRS